MAVHDGLPRVLRLALVRRSPAAPLGFEVDDALPGRHVRLGVPSLADDALVARLAERYPVVNRTASSAFNDLSVLSWAP